MSYSQMIIEDNDGFPPDMTWKHDDPFAPIPWPPKVEIDAGHSTPRIIGGTIDCAVPYVLPVLGIALGGVVLVLALGYWAIQKLRLW